MIIRNAKESDFPRISELLQDIAKLHAKGRPEIFKPASQKYSLSEFKDMLKDPNHPVFVAQSDNDDIVGYAFCELKDHPERSVAYERKCLYLDDLCVDERMRGKGVGRSLMDRLKKFAKENGCFSIELNVWEFNENAIAFYEKYGMHTQRRQMELLL